MLMTGTVEYCANAVDHAVFAIDGLILEFGEKRARRSSVDVARQHARDFGDVFLGVAVHHGCRRRTRSATGVLARLQHTRMAAELSARRVRSSCACASTD